MAIVLVTYDLKKPGRDYQPVHAYLKTFTYCKGLESVWLLDTPIAVTIIRDRLNGLVDANDIVFVVRITGDWASRHYGCAEWLNNAARSW